jgi:hypothetical protein
VRRVGSELSQLRYRLVDPTQHGIQRVRQLTEFIVCGRHCQASRQIRGVDAARVGGDLRDRRQGSSAQPVATETGENQCERDHQHQHPAESRE